MADTSLIFNIIARDKTTAVIERLKRNTASATASIAAAFGPALLPVMASATGAAIGFGAALGGAGAAAGVFGAVAKTSFTEISEAATKVDDLRNKMRLYGREASILAAQGKDNEKYLKKQADAALELKARLALLPPETRRATMAFMDMKSDWQDFVEANQPATFNIMAQGFTLVGQVVARLQPLFDMGAYAAQRLVSAASSFVQGGGIARIAAIAGPALQTLISIILNVGSALGTTFGKFAGQGQGILDWIDRATSKWAAWSKQTGGGGLQKFVDYATTNGPRVYTLLSQIATAAVNIVRAVSPLAPISLAIATALASLIAAVPPPVLTALVAGFIAFNIAMRLWALGSAIATAAQWALNSALLASPITWIVIAIVALVAIIYLVATRTRFFQTIWNAVWGFMKRVGAWFAGPFAGFFVMVWGKIVAFAKGVWHAVSVYFGSWRELFNLVRSWVGSAVNWVRDKFTWLVAYIRGLPGRIRASLYNMWSGWKAGFRNAINYIIGAWNRLHFTIPSFNILGKSFGGGSIGVPHIPYMDVGGDVTQTGLAVVHRGERVLTPAQTERARGGGGGTTLVIKSDGRRTSNMLLELLREAIRDRGGDPVKVLTAR